MRPKAKQHIKKREKFSVPPQLVGILADAVAIGATGFRLEPNPPHLMASFSTRTQAAEIDFEASAGQEMMDYLAVRVTDPKTRTSRFVLEYEGKPYACRATLDCTRNPQHAEVSWT